MKKNRIVLIIGLIIISIIGITYAIYTWAFTERLSGESECFNINYVKGQDIGSDTESAVIYPSTTYKGGLSATVSVSTDSSCTINKGTGTLYLTTEDSTGTALLTSSALKYQILEGTTLKESGSITSTGTIPISNSIEVTTTSKSYTVTVWIDKTLLYGTKAEEILTSIYKGYISMRVESGV